MSLLTEMGKDPRDGGPASREVVLEIRANCPDCSGRHRSLQITLSVPGDVQPIHCPLCKRVLFQLGPGGLAMGPVRAGR